MPLGDEAIRAASRQMDFHECVPCGGKCCRTPWTVFVTPRDIDRLERSTGLPPAAFVEVKPLPAWEKEAFGEGNLLFARVTSADGRVPQLRKDASGACVFLDAQGLCGVHDSKPLLCRLFPFYYEREPFSSREQPTPRGTRSGGLRLLVDRGHQGFCPITPERIAEVEGSAGAAVLALCETFEKDVASYERHKETFVREFDALHASSRRATVGDEGG